MPGEGTGTGGGTGNTGGAGTGGAAGGSGGSGEGGERRGPRVKRRRGYQPASEIVQNLLAGYGSSDRALEALAGENYDLREERRELTQELEKIKPRVPADGAVILTGAEAESWKKIKLLADEKKITPEKLGDTLVERVKLSDTLESANTKSELSKKRKAVAAAAGVNGDVLDPLLDTYSLEVRTVDMQVQGTDGKTTTKQIAEVRKAGDANASWERLTDFVAKADSPLKPFAVALATKPSGQSGTGGTSGGGTSSAAGITFPEQQGGNTGGGGGDGNSLVNDFLKKDKERAERPNPLRAPTQTTTTAKGAA